MFLNNEFMTINSEGEIITINVTLVKGQISVNDFKNNIRTNI